MENKGYGSGYEKLGKRESEELGRIGKENKKFKLEKILKGGEWERGQRLGSRFYIKSKIQKKNI